MENIPLNNRIPLYVQKNFQYTTKENRHNNKYHRDKSEALRNLTVAIEGAGPSGLTNALQLSNVLGNQGNIIISEKRIGSNVTSRNQIVAITQDAFDELKKLGVNMYNMQRLTKRIDKGNNSITTLCKQANNNSLAKLINNHVGFIKIGDLQQELLNLCLSRRNITYLDGTTLDIKKSLYSKRYGVTIKSTQNKDRVNLYTPDIIIKSSGRNENEEFGIPVTLSYDPTKVRNVDNIESIQANQLQDMKLLVFQLKSIANDNNVIRNGACFDTEKNKYRLNLDKEELFLAVLNTQDLDENGNQYTRYQFNIQLPSQNTNSNITKQYEESIILNSINLYFQQKYANLEQALQVYKPLQLFNIQGKSSNNSKSMRIHSVMLSIKNLIRHKAYSENNLYFTGDYVAASSPLGAVGINKIITHHSIAVKKLGETILSKHNWQSNPDKYKVRENFSKEILRAGIEWTRISSITMKPVN